MSFTLGPKLQLDAVMLHQLIDSGSETNPRQSTGACRFIKKLKKKKSISIISKLSYLF